MDGVVGGLVCGGGLAWVSVDAGRWSRRNQSGRLNCGGIACWGMEIWPVEVWGCGLSNYGWCLRDGVDATGGDIGACAMEISCLWVVSVV